MQSERETTAEELRDELLERDRVKEAVAVHENAVRFVIEEGTHGFDIPEILNWYVDSVTDYKNHGVGITMVFIK